LEENQNTNESLQPQEAILLKTQETSESTVSATSRETKVETPAPLPEQQSTNQQQAAEMEVHKHPHHVMHKKKWSEYLLEFFMIFIAVFLGFLAENIREHISEKKSASQFLETYYNELLQQQQQIINFENKFKDKLIVCDSVVNIYNNGEENQKLDYLAASTFKAKQIINIPFNTSSYEQMVSSGALRYIGNSDLRDSIASYKNQIELAKAYNNEITDAIIKNTFEIGKIEDLHNYIPADTSSSYDFLNHIPSLKPFQKLTEEQRRQLITFYVFYMAQAQSNLRRLRTMYSSNKELVEMINKELN
jgi:hypothetical protein